MAAREEGRHRGQPTSEAGLFEDVSLGDKDIDRIFSEARPLENDEQILQGMATQLQAEITEEIRALLKQHPVEARQMEELRAGKDKLGASEASILKKILTPSLREKAARLRTLNKILHGVGENGN